MQFIHRTPMRLLPLLMLAVIGLSGSKGAQAQTTSEFPGTIYFEVGKSDFNPTFRENAETMFRIIETIDSLNLDDETAIRSIKVSTSTSPEGGKKLNVKLASDRSKSIVDYLMAIYPRLTQQIVISSELAPDWASLREQALASNLPERYEIVGILDLYREYRSDDLGAVDPREQRLKDINDGKVWRYCIDNFFPNMRYAKVELLHELIATDDDNLEEVVAAKEVEKPAQPVYEPEPEPVATVVTPPAKPRGPRFLFAIKSNLLFDALGGFNGAIEVPVADHWSIQAEAVWPWFVGGRDQWCEQMGMVDGEVRCWLGGRNIGNPLDPSGKRNPLTGHFLGLTGGWAYYDFERNDKGYQGEGFMAGLVYGYSTRLGKHFNLELEVGLGYAHTGYRQYDVQIVDGEKLLVDLDKHGHYNWFGPVAAKVTISWLLYKN